MTIVLVDARLAGDNGLHELGPGRELLLAHGITVVSDLLVVVWLLISRIILDLTDEDGARVEAKVRHIHT